MTRPTAPPPRLPSERMRVGACEVDVPLREVRAPGARRPVRITPKSMAVLLALAESPGRVLSRDTLLSQVWPDTLPTNDVLTQAVTQLRKALRETRDAPRYIETIAKTGYRLLAPVQWLDVGDAAAPVMLAAASGTALLPASPDASAPVDTPASTAPITGLPASAVSAPPGTTSDAPRATPARHARQLLPRRWRTVLAAAGVLALGAALSAPWFWRGGGEVRVLPPEVVSRGGVAPPEYRLITSAPGFEVSPALSPDASRVAYVARPAGRRESAIFVQATQPTSPRQLTRPPEGRNDEQPAWSPDGQAVAFLRVGAGGCEVRIAPVAAGTERVAGQCDARGMPMFDWSPDGRRLVFSSRAYPGAGPGLALLDLATGHWRRVAYPGRVDDIDTAPRFTPDGRTLVFVRNPPLADFWQVPVGGGEAKPLARLGADLEGWDFTTDGRAIVFSRWRDSESRLYRLDVATGRVTELGLRDGEDPALAADADALVFSQQRNYFGLYRFDARGGAGQRLFPSSGRDRMPAIAPDGRQLLFASDRTGRFNLWWADLGRPESLRMLDGVLPESRHLPEWSADSRHALLVGSDAQGRAGLFEVEPATGRITRLPVPRGMPLQAAYAGPDRVYVVAGVRDGRRLLTLYDRRSTPWRALATLDDVATVHASPDGRSVRLARTGRAGLWQADASLDASSVRLLDPERPVPGRYRQWALGPGDSVLLLDSSDACSALLRRGLHDRAPRCLDRERYAAINGLSADPRTGDVYVSLSESLGGDIGFVRLDRAALAAR